MLFMYEKIKINQNEIEYLRNSDDKMKKLIDLVGDIDREYITNPFIALVNSIVFQQLAYKAAISIWNRFENLVKDITPQNILNTDDKSLRECGLSKTKINYIKNLSQATIEGELDFKRFEEMTDEEIIEKLIKIKGIGVWTAEMFLIFALNRKNILSFNDLGIRKGLKWLYKMKKEPTKEQFNRIKKKYSPYNTLASFYLWEITIRDFFKYEDIEKVNINNNVAYLKSPIGFLEIQSNGDKITSLDFVDERRYEEKSHPILEEAKKQLSEYFEGKRREFKLPIAINGTDFQNRVWKELLKISYGETKTYGEIADKIGNAKASRAVGNANNKNKIAIIIPCHRVVGSNGKLVGYEGGIWRKKWLLEHEKNTIKALYKRT